ncbi:MAG: oligosaccharide flippase family protein [Lachnospiraceae bacterium]|nr:oligosaccharide flippase family protein [Lachnospiraceae bacterium]
MKQKASLNSMLLAGARLFATVSSLLITMILTKTLDLSVNGTYSQCLTIISVGLSINSLGLMDGGNYFFVKAESRQEKQTYIDALLFLVYLSGLIMAAGLILLRSPISTYFSNPALKDLLWLIAFRPMLASLINVLNVLYIATDRAKQVVLRNAEISLVHLVIVVVTAFTTKNATMILLLYLIAEIVTDALMLFSFVRSGFSIRPRLPSKEILCGILKYCLPMAAYIAMNSLFRDSDKLIIGRFESTEMQAIYSNCAKILPLDVISSAFCTILVPKMTQCLSRNQPENAARIFANYLKIGLLSTATFALAVALCPDQAIFFLYSADYLKGKNVFVLYNLVELIKFANVTIVISAVGRAKTLMMISAVALGANLLISLALYEWLGFIGPAVGTVIVTMLTVIALLTVSTKILRVSFLKILDLKFVGGYVLKAGASALVCLLLKKVLINAAMNQYFVLFAVCGLFCLLMLAINLRQLKRCLLQIDRNQED